MLATLSRYTHVAIAADEKNVYEATLGGVREVSLSTCIGEVSRAWILASPKEYADNDAERLKLEFLTQKESGCKYSYFRSFFAGLEAIANAWFYIISTLIIAWAWLYDETAFLPVSLILLAYFPIVRKVKLLARSQVIKNNRFIPQRFTQDIPDKFCSQLVVDLESKINGFILKNIQRPHEPRPCDVVEACIIAGYKRTRIRTA